MVERIVNSEDVSLLVSGRQSNPHKFLGIVSETSSQDRIILFRPGAHSVVVELQGNIAHAQHHHSGIFSLTAPKGTLPQDYRIYHQNGLLAHDPYAFPPLWGEVDSFLFHQGTHYKIYERMGAIPYDVQGISGVLFVVWAPHAQRVSVVGDFNFWNGLVNPLRKVSDLGVWELFIPGLEEGTLYKWEIVSASGEVLIKTDPYGKRFDVPPHAPSRVVDSDRYTWHDAAWMEKRKHRGDQPLAIYEVHVGSWKWHEGKPLGYRELAKKLAAYCKEMHYTHVELLPVTEHPLNESWGYQVTGYYAPTCRYGTPEDFQFFVDHLHRENIGVILDWVPGHFPTDGFALAHFDGEALYESIENQEPLHPHWRTYTFDYRCNEVVNFLLGSALFWLDKMHIDGLRVDAVTSMLYLDYGRQEGEWSPNIYGGRENLQAIEFIKHLNSIVHREFPGVLTFAEESTDFPKVTQAVAQGGLGFDYKWNLGWMHDTFRYIQVDPLFRSYHHKDLTFSLWYAFNERYLLPLSHDEVVHGKGSLLQKMPGDTWTKFAHMRLLLSYHICQPGKKLLFMGGEFAQGKEWVPDSPLDWHLLDHPDHAYLHKCVARMNALYCDLPYFWKGDGKQESFCWVDFKDTENHVIAYYRFSREDRSSALLCVHHFSSGYFPSYVLHCQDIHACQLLFNSDDRCFGGSGKGNRQPVLCLDQHVSWGIDIELPPLATLIFYVDFVNQQSSI
ncbi:1,4-alpha-glucan branching protein GlgB [Chlamydia abortus]|uniref:1,4-alpha-glucan branching protein GlgB n=1 Tax=Chlamydia abortus TaxID=83555 RepID=UPI001117833D|nr:1,4-alpha-glucan branching protein GlgB [Chlamydia abortus]